MPIRYAIFVAVSTAEQAKDDKVSLSVQEQRCREAARARNWIETCEPYRIPGESRTIYVNLSLAEAAMPDLKRMLDDARDGKFDVLVMYDYDRLRDLLGLVSKSLSHYRVQMFAVNLPVEPIAPSEFNPYKNDMAIMMETFAMMKQRAQTNDLRRKYMEAMPRRASQRGLPVHVPFGYKRPASSKVPPEQDEKLIEYVVKMKDLFMSGKSTSDIADWMQTTGVKPKGKRWYAQTIKEILKNPFYAGFVRWGATRSELDPRTSRVKRIRKIDPSRLSIGKGLHQPVWDEYTHHAILAEFKRRGKTYTGKTNQALSSLLSCEICGQRLWAYYNNSVTGADNLIWRCSSRQEHVVIRNPEALRLIEKEIRDYVNGLAQQPEPVADSAEQEARLKLQNARDERARLVNAYTLGLIRLDEFSTLKVGMDDNVSECEHKLEEYVRAARQGGERRVVIETLRANLPSLAEFLRGPHAEVNFVLRKMIADVLVQTSGEIAVTWA